MCARSLCSVFLCLHLDDDDGEGKWWANTKKRSVFKAPKTTPFSCCQSSSAFSLDASILFHLQCHHRSTFRISFSGNERINFTVVYFLSGCYGKRCCWRLVMRMNFFDFPFKLHGSKPFVAPETLDELFTHRMTFSSFSPGQLRIFILWAQSLVEWEVYSRKLMCFGSLFFHWLAKKMGTVWNVWCREGEWKKRSPLLCNEERWGFFGLEEKRKKRFLWSKIRKRKWSNVISSSRIFFHSHSHSPREPPDDDKSLLGAILYSGVEFNFFLFFPQFFLHPKTKVKERHSTLKRFKSKWKNNIRREIAAVLFRIDLENFQLLSRRRLLLSLVKFKSISGPDEKKGWSERMSNA